jgi:hypothetical protein
VPAEVAPNTGTSVRSTSATFARNGQWRGWSLGPNVAAVVPNTFSTGRPFKRSHLVALRTTKITASDPPSTWWPGER